MHSLYYVDLIKRAVASDDDELLSNIAFQLASSEIALGILRAKGYGQSGTHIDDTARQVPEAR